MPQHQLVIAMAQPIIRTRWNDHAQSVPRCRANRIAELVIGRHVKIEVEGIRGEDRAGGCLQLEVNSHPALAYDGVRTVPVVENEFSAVSGGSRNRDQEGAAEPLLALAH